MNITVYLPDELGKEAKEANLPFSRLLQAAVREELIRLERIDAVAWAWPYSTDWNLEQL